MLLVSARGMSSTSSTSSTSFTPLPTLLPLPHFLEKRAGERAERAAQRRAKRGEEAAVVAGSVGADVEQLRGNAQAAREEVRVHTEQAGQALQGGRAALERGIREVELILRGLIGLGDDLLPREFVLEIAESRGVAGACHAVLRRPLQRGEGAGQRALRRAGNGRFVRGAEARIVQDGLELRHEEIADLLLRAEELLVQRVDVRQLLIGELASLCLCATGHGSPQESRYGIEIRK